MPINVSNDICGCFAPIYPMKPHYDPTLHHRRSIRLKGYDYSQPGAYFVTLVTYQRKCLLGEITDSAIHLSREGNIVGCVWSEIPNHFPYTTLGDFIIMPNHLHGIIAIQGNEASTQCKGEASASKSGSPPNDFVSGCFAPTGTVPGSLSAIIQNFKSVSTRRVNLIRQVRGLPIWQRNFYEHIIRDEGEYQRIAAYIRDNPSRWNDDQEIRPR